ncbi:hypothetical protein [Salarchaeum sp. JOR-1]|uniref:hypothetical protein n=1 Tax=Salarchaeum sp. JOR-1 TaxID=2599399 RepID=UPI00119881A6|nr:hypothetical protein [Salarchaeum sp. JOR-1]QDX41062.1 hypothetical protein FQU85_09190 [Salarchaeum sp. JOR-1]
MGLFEKIAVYDFKLGLSMAAGGVVYACFMLGGYWWAGEQGMLYGIAVGVLVGLATAVVTWRRLPN